MSFLDKIEHPDHPNVYTDRETRQNVYFFEEIHTEDGSKMECVGWMNRHEFTDSMIDHVQEYLKNVWCTDENGDPGDLDIVRSRLRNEHKRQGLH